MKQERLLDMREPCARLRDRDRANDRGRKRRRAGNRKLAERKSTERGGCASR